MNHIATTTQAVAEPVPPAPGRLARMARSGPFLAGAVIVLFWLFCAWFGPEVVPYDPYRDDLMNALAAPSAARWFGTA